MYEAWPVRLLAEIEVALLHPAFELPTRPDWYFRLSRQVYCEMTPEAAAVRGGSTAPVVMWAQDPYPEDSVVQYNFTK